MYNIEQNRATLTHPLSLYTSTQLVDRGTFINGTTVNDKPRYQFRASMIDTSRHYYPVTVIYQHLDAMAYSKVRSRAKQSYNPLIARERRTHRDFICACPSLRSSPRTPVQRLARAF